MSHALYPGLNNGNPRDRPTTAESHKTWYGNNRKSYASSTSSFRSDYRSMHSVAPADEVPGEDLGDLIHRTRRVLSVLSVQDDDGEKTDKKKERRYSYDYDSDHESRHKNESAAVVRQKESGKSAEETASQTATSSHQAPARTSSLPSPGPAGTVASRSSLNSTVMSLASPDGVEGETTVQQSPQTLSQPESTVDKQQPSPPSTRAGSQSASHRNKGHALRVSDSEVSSTHGSIVLAATPAEDTTAAPSIAIPWDASPKKDPSSLDIKAVTSSSSSSGSSTHETEKPPAQEDPHQPTTPDASTAHLTGLPLVSLTIALSAAVFLVAMDVNVIATAIPRITGEFRSLDDVGWYGSAFLMATCATQIPYGRVYALFPAKWVFTSAIGVFMLGSLVAGVAPNSPVLILGRAVQGVGTSGILSGGLIIMAQVVPLRVRPVLTSVIGAMEGVAMISAPIIGGVLTDNFHWRWCFYINLPIGGFVLIVVLFCMRSTTQTGLERGGETVWETLYKLDLIGAATLLPPIVCTLLALHFAGMFAWWCGREKMLTMVQEARATRGVTTMSSCCSCWRLSCSVCL